MNTNTEICDMKNQTEQNIFGIDYNYVPNCFSRNGGMLYMELV